MSRIDRQRNDYSYPWTAFVARWEYMFGVIFARVAVRAQRRLVIRHQTEALAPADPELVRRAARAITREFRA